MKRVDLVSGTINSHTTQMDDNEDSETIEIIQQPIVKKNTKKQKSKKKPGIITTTSIPVYKKKLKDEEKEFVEFVLGDFHDFHKISDLSIFVKMTSLTLLNESITNIESIINNIPNKEAMKFLCLNENQITDMKSIELLTNLEELHLNYNQIVKIENPISNMKKLKKIWICDNKIKILENLPECIENLWLANNLIEKIPDDIEKHKNINFLNIAGNCIIDLKDIYNIQKLTKLKRLYLSDINYGENPICHYSNYRSLLIHFFPDINILDQIIISPEERKEIESMFIKRNLFCKNKIRQNHKITKMIFQILKTHKLFLINMKLQQCNYFSQKKEMINFARYEKESLLAINNASIEEIYKEIDELEEKKEKCLKIIEIINERFKIIKQYISELNDLNIVINFYELESNSNFKIEPGYIGYKWVKTCIDLIKMRISKDFYTNNNFENIKFKKIFKITNKKSKVLFDSLYDNLIDINGKFGDEKKYFDFYFLILPKEKSNYRSLFYLLFEQPEEEKEIYITDNFSYIDQLDINNHETKNTKFCVICKCINFESLIEEQKKYSEFKDINDIISSLNNIRTNKGISKIILNNSNIGFYYYKMKGIVEPEYIIEYDYIMKMNENDLNIDPIICSYSEKIEIINDYESLFNKCSKDLYFNKFPKQYYNKEIINKYSFSKFGEFNELDNNILFFAKNIIFEFFNNCFKYQNYKEFTDDVEKIHEKLNQITKFNFTKNFKNIFMNEKDKLKFDEIKSLILFNCKYNTDDIIDIIKKIKDEGVINEIVEQFRNNIDEIILTKNNIEYINIGLLCENFPNLKKINLSHNNINKITYEPKEVKNKINEINISFNNITDFSNIITILNSCNYLSKFEYYANPIEKYYQFLLDNPIKNSIINTETRQNIIDIYEEYYKKSHSQIATISVNSDSSKINNENKNFDYIYDCYCFSDKFHSFSNNIYFREKIHKESGYQTIILSKRKLDLIPIVEGKKDTQVLYINLNKIPKITNLQQFTDLIELYIQNNKIEKIENLPKNLIKLDISNNKLTSLIGISQAENLEWLNIENNAIQSISQIIQLQKLIKFYSAGNFINNSKECKQLGKLKNLEILDISGNEVCRINRDIRITMIYYCLKLKNFNRINVDASERLKAKEYFNGKLTPELLEKRLGSGFNTKNLIEIDLSSLKLKDEIGIFSNDIYPKLTKLNLSRNIFKTFNIFGYLPSLIELNLNFNLFTDILPKKEKGINGKGIFGLINLESLEMSSNQLVNLNGIQFFKNLKILVLRENSISKIEAINKMNSLTFLDVSFNKLRNVEKTTIGFLPSIQIFLCDNNYLKNINGFTKFLSIQTLSFENNKIQDISSLERLSTLENLKDFSILNCPVTKNLNYRNNMIKLFPGLIKLDGGEITNEEREMIMMDIQMGEDYQDDINNFYPNDFFHNKMPGNTTYNIQKIQDKGLKRVNYVQIGLVSPNCVNPSLKHMLSPKKGINLPQIRPVSYINSKSNTSDSRKKAYMSGNKNQNNQVYKNNNSSNYNNKSVNNNLNNLSNVNNFSSKDYYGYITKSLANDLGGIKYQTNYNSKKGYK